MTTPPSTWPEAGVPEPSSGVGIPDAATIARWANEFYRALPGTGATPSAAPAVIPAPAAPAPAQAAQGVPVAPGSLPVAGVEPVTADRGWGGASPGSVPLAAAGPVPTAAPTFYFLDERTGPGAADGLGTVPTTRDWYVIEERTGHPAFDADVPRDAARRPDDPSAGYDLHAVRADFPILSERVNGGKPLVWLDNAATTHKPRAVIDRLTHFYSHENSNIHRAAHDLAARATDAYEGARSTIANFIGAQPEEIVYTRGTTESINLVASAWGRQNLGPGDEVILSHLEHHANIVPWQLLAQEKGFTIKVIPVDDNADLLLDAYAGLLSPRTKLVSVTWVANATGTVTPVQEIVAMAHAAGALTLVDAAQSIAHLPVDVRAVDTDFLVFSGHKIYGPTGIGVLYGRKAVLETLSPYQGGGNMIADVTFERTVFQPPPHRFEAGTGNIADAVGLGTALDYVSSLGLPAIAAYEHGLIEYAIACLESIRGVRLIGHPRLQAGAISFVLDGYTTAEVGKALSDEGIAVRSGHHCAQPILRRFGVESTVRPSFALYNIPAEIDALAEVVWKLARTRR